MTFFDKLISSLKYYGIVYFIFLIIIIGMGIIYLNKIDFISVSKYVPPAMTKDTLQPPDLSRDTLQPPYKKGETMPPVDIMKMGKPSQELIDKGKSQYSSICSGCHGTEGKGDGPAGAMLSPKPRNFTDLNGWKNGPMLSLMYRTLQEGIPGSAMASFSYIPPIDRISIIHYIRTLNPNYPAVTDAELAEMDKTYSLSKGFSQPNQMPLSAALDKILKDEDTLQSELESIRKIIEKETKDTAAVLFKKIVRDMPRALNLLAADTFWNKSLNEFVRVIELDPVNSGYRTTVYGLSEGEFNMIYLYLRRLFIL